MKKSLVAVGVIVALGVIWTGASWYTGKQLEARLPEMLATANSQLQQNIPQAGLVLGYENYQRGLFSSHMQLVIKPQENAQQSWLKAGKSVLLDEKVSHGPLPLAELKHFNLAPAMASVQTTLVKNETTQKLFDMAEGKSFVDAQTRIAWSGATASDIQLLPLTWQDQDDKLTFSGGHITTSIDNAGNAIVATGSADSATIATVNEYGQHVQLSFSGLKTSGDTTLSGFKERTGMQNIALDNLKVAIEGKEMAVIEGISLNAKSEVENDGKHLGATLDYALSSLKIQSQDLGSGKLSMKFANIDGEALHEFGQKYNQQTQALLANGDAAANPELYHQQTIGIFLENLPLLLKGAPAVTVAPLSWKNDKGESTLNLSLLLQEPPAGDNASVDLLTANGVKSFDGKLVIPMDMATGLMTQVAKLEGYQQADAEKLADQQVKGLAAMGQMFRLTTTENNTITSSLQYADGKVSLNGQQMPLADFLGMFGLTAPQSTEPATPAEPAAPAESDPAP